MSRARITALALVNWKGVFFERYLLDRHVTALEGANGAGKTTVMIAAYVVLLPDMTRLRFTNLGESGATGGDRGIWGRLGELGRPAYAALDLDLGGERVVLGVCLTRTTEPTVEPTAFMVSGLSEATRLSEFLLVRRDDGDHVPELAELKAGATRVGGTIQVFRSVKDYFSALFERGITPLCLSFDEERNKWNDMLRTSMTGGISRALGSELRSFLLREESGLSDTLSRMRENLESCRRTRIEVLEARKLEREISAIYEAGLSMFAAALHASRAASLEARQRAREAAQASQAAQEAHAQLLEESAQLQLREAELAQRNQQKRDELAQLEAAKQRRAAAQQLSTRLAALDVELGSAEQKLTAASAEQQSKQQAREAAKQARQWTLEAYDRASVGLASLQKGLEELARRAHAHKELARCLEEARELLARADLSVDDAEQTLSALAQQRSELEAERAALSRKGRDLEVRRQEHTRALRALSTLEASTLLSQPTAADASLAAEDDAAKSPRGAAPPLGAASQSAAEDLSTLAATRVDDSEQLRKGGVARSAGSATLEAQASAELANALDATAAERDEQAFVAGSATLEAQASAEPANAVDATAAERDEQAFVARSVTREAQASAEPANAVDATAAERDEQAFVAGSVTREVQASAEPANAVDATAAERDEQALGTALLECEVSGEGQWVQTLADSTAGHPRDNARLESRAARSASARVLVEGGGAVALPAAPLLAAAQGAAMLEGDAPLSAARRSTEKGRGALAQLVAAAVARQADAHEQARWVLARAAEIEAELSRFGQVEEELREARRLRMRQDAARSLAAELAVAINAGESEAVGVPALLTALEAELHSLEQRLHPDAEALTARQRLEALRREHAALDQRAACYRLAQEAAVRLVQSGALSVDDEHGRAISQARENGTHEAGAARAVLDSQAALLGLRDRLLREQLALQARRDSVEAERECMQAQAAELNRGGAVYDAELLRVCEELGGELLATRFEDLEPAQAAWVQARLGPWVEALVVDDVDAAAAQLAKLEHTRRDVHLVRAGESLDITPPEADSGADILVQEAFGTRISKLPAASDLGRRTREAKLRELWQAIAAHATLLEELATASQQNAAQRRDADVLWTHAALWLGPDPLAQRAELEQEIARFEQADAERQAAATQARKQLVAARARAEGLRRLLPDAQLLGAPDYAERVRELEARTALLGRARNELSQLSAARAELSRFLDVLRSPPPDDAALAQQAARLEQLEAELDRIFRARSSLEGVLALRHAADFADAQAALDAQAELSPALERQQQQARQQLQEAESTLNTALSAWETATAVLQSAQAEKAALSTQRERLLEEQSALSAPEEMTPEAEELQLSAAEAELTRLADAARRSVAERALAEERCARAEAELQAARSRQGSLLAEAEPVERSWNALREAAEGAGVLHAALSLATGSSSSFQLQAEAKSKRELLLDRVLRARSGDELQQAITEADSELTSWQAVRAWLSRRVPAQVAQVDDPLLALTRLSDHLNMLEARLTRQEGDLRGSSEDVARGIAVQLRRAHSQVRRLNQHLDGIRFGSIHGIRIEMRRIERMEQILSALRAGQAQELLFSSSLPIEEALDEIFKRFGGGGKSGGQRLLDYREYVELAVEIRRHNADGWEPANPTRLSTGEAIGVGAALMMVVLTEWERASSLLGPRNKLGSLRFLFLDEANRLSRDNLGVLFDLCRTLDLQLLVAAPEVARADGNTTYRLVRHTTVDGREEVIVSGRRSVPVAEGEQPDAALATEVIAEDAPQENEAAAHSGSLFD